jgi:hypothetical protein
MLVACRLAGLSTLQAHYASVMMLAQSWRRCTDRPRPSLLGDAGSRVGLAGTSQTVDAETALLRRRKAL